MLTAATITPAPMPWSALETALRDRHPVLVCYHGRRRLICPYALGWRAGRPMVLGYQTGEQTTPGSIEFDPVGRWRCFYVDKIDEVAAADQTCRWVSSDSYNPAQPFPAGVVDDLAIAITPRGAASASERG